MFSTADDNQTAVTIHVLQGEREMAAGNKSLGQFNLDDIPPAPRGMPQIEVTFDIDANGILHVIRQGQGHRQGKQDHHQGQLRPVRRRNPDAWCRTPSCTPRKTRRAHELVDARNQADGLVHSVKKSLAEYGDKLDADEKEARSKPPSRKPKTRSSGDDKADIDAKTEALATASQKLGEKMYAAAAGRRRLRPVQPVPAPQPAAEPTRRQRGRCRVQRSERTRSKLPCQTRPVGARAVLGPWPAPALGRRMRGFDTE